jgi:hypothetical protein
MVLQIVRLISISFHPSRSFIQIHTWSSKTPGGQNTLNGASNVTTFSAESSANSEIALSTTSPEIVFVNALTGIEARRIATTSMITHLLFSHSTLVSGAFDGCVRLHDPRTGLRKDSKGGSNATIKAHNGSIQGIQSAGNYLYTIGYGVRYFLSGQSS